MDHQEWQQLVKAGRLLDAIREKPPMYLGERSLSALCHFLNGFWFGSRLHDPSLAHPLPADFHDWVAYRLHFFESTSGYRNMILKHVPDEAAALDRFFLLLDEHRNRKPRVVARISGYDKEFTKQTVKNGRLEPPRTGRYPATLNLIAYTDDPGFFISSDDTEAEFPRKGRFFPTLEWFGRRFGISRDELTILDSETFNRWLAEEKRFSSQTAQKREPQV